MFIDERFAAGLPGPIRLLLEKVQHYPTERNKAFIVGYAEGFKRGKRYAAEMTDEQMHKLIELVEKL